ncbi:histidinol phosphate phosphatase domain-containing protein [Candidatus Poribacteria bacterium]|nr:histidinol phosphate phosphatase domain-containing protein [Candidatus Poribacteria bacterium]
MIDLHTHSLFSDGVLLPAELVQRAEYIGYDAIGITDHVDHSNIDFVVPHITRFAESVNGITKINVIPGVEITHVPPVAIASLAKRARKLGAKLVLVHGETIVEPVPPGTDHHALLADINILAHPGLIEPDDVKLAAQRGICLEITARKGHSLTNGHVAKLALDFGAKLVLNTDSHDPSNLITRENAIRVAKGAGLKDKQMDEMFNNSKKLVEKIL